MHHATDRRPLLPCVVAGLALVGCGSRDATDAATDARALDAAGDVAAAFDATDRAPPTDDAVAHDVAGDALDAGLDASDAAPPYLIGTLQSQCTHARELWDAGARVATMEMAWNQYETPSDNMWNAAYIASQRSDLDCFVRQGFRVILGLGTQYPPAWLNSIANSHHRNQYGDETGLNLTFNADVRRQFDEYTQQVAHDLDLHGVWAVRVGSGANIEVLFPPMTYNSRANGYWAYDVNAQGTGPQPVASVGPPPFVGWQPGQSTFGGAPFTAAMATRWLDWYLAAMSDGVSAQIASLRRAGFTGYAQVLMPGVGARPTYVNRALNTLLDGSTDGLHVIGRGAVWQQIAARVVDPGHAITLYCSSMADGSGGNDLCAPGDTAVDYTATPTAVDPWSATRWVSYLAHRHGDSAMGENPGLADSHGTYGVGMMETTAAQMHACGMLGFAWAHEFEFYTADSGVTLTDFARVIHEYDP